MVSLILCCICWVRSSRAISASIHDPHFVGNPLTVVFRLDARCEDEEDKNMRTLREFVPPGSEHHLYMSLNKIKSNDGQKCKITITMSGNSFGFQQHNLFKE